MKIRKFVALVTTFTLALAVFAEPKSTGVNDSDVKNWAKNFTAINRELDDTGISTDEITSASKKEKAQAEKILQKYGITTPNAIEKYAMINQCATLLMVESGGGTMEGMDAATMAMMKQMGIDPFAEMRANINSKDYKVVKANEKAVTNAMNGVMGDYSETSASEDSDTDSYDEEDSEIAYEKQRAQPYIDSINNDSKPVRDFYNALSKSRGDCTFLYKSVDAKNAAKYTKKKTAGEKGEIYIHDGDSVDGTFDFKKNTVVFNARWTEAEFDMTAPEDLLAGHIRKTDVKKTLKFTIKSVEKYETAGLSPYNNEEYVITTKEGPIIHLLRKQLAYDLAEFTLNFNGAKEELECSGF